MSIRVLNTFPIGGDDVEMLAGVSPRFEFVHEPLSADDLDELEDERLEILLGGRTPRDERKTPGLRWLQVASGGVEQLWDDPAWRRGITVTNARGTYATTIAEYTLWALLDLNQRGAVRRRAQSNHYWPAPEEEDEYLGRLLRGQTVLILGYGSVGREVARLADGFGMRVVAIKARPAQRRDESFHGRGTGDPEGTIPEEIGGFDDIGEFARGADALVVSVPLTDRTRGLVNADVLDALRPGAVVINVARGPIVELSALQVSLQSGRLGGAVVDVFPTEPLPSDDPLWDQTGFVVTPHVSGGIAGAPIGVAWGILYQLVAENLRRYLAGDPLLNVVDPKRGY